MDMKKQNSKAVEDDRLKQMREIVDLNIGDLTVEQLFESLSERTRNVIQNTSKLLDRHYMAREVLLPIARNMAQLEPNREYWTNVETPVQPIGLLPGEAVLRLIVMALPYLLYVGVAQFTGWTMALVGVPAYLLAFFGADFFLRRAVDRKSGEERELDRGRWAFTQLLCQMLKSSGIKEEFVTLDVLNKIRVYGCWTRVVNAVAKRDEAAKQGRIAAARARRAAWIAAGAPDSRGAPTVAYATVDAATRARYAEEDAELARFEVAQLEVAVPAANPSTGLPMVGTSGIDTSGHAFGTGTFGGGWND